MWLYAILPFLLIQTDSRASFDDLLKRHASDSATACTTGYDDLDGRVDSTIFVAARDAVLQALNSDPSSEPRARAAAVLKRLEQTSAVIDHEWPDESRFHASVAPVPPLLVVRAEYRQRSTIWIFALNMPRHGDPAWLSVTESSGVFVRDDLAPHMPAQSVNVYAVATGPSERARVLVRSRVNACLNRGDISYRLLEWNEFAFDLEEVITIDGIEGVHPPKGTVPKLQTDGARITLPYCFHSVLDTVDDPALCAADTFDLSGDRVRFVDRAVNAPELLPIAQAFKYAQAHDYPAVRAYCATDAVAREIVAQIPPEVVVDAVRVTDIDGGKRVEFGILETFTVDVEPRGARWVVTRFAFER